MWSLLAIKVLQVAQGGVESTRASRGGGLLPSSCEASSGQVTVLALERTSVLPAKHEQRGVKSRYALVIAGREGRRMTPCAPMLTRASG
jgi:hypothetical protein